MDLKPILTIISGVIGKSFIQYFIIIHVAHHLIHPFAFCRRRRHRRRRRRRRRRRC
jgi:hypothetical protein